MWVILLKTNTRIKIMTHEEIVMQIRNEACKKAREQYEKDTENGFNQAAAIAYTVSIYEADEQYRRTS